MFFASTSHFLKNDWTPIIVSELCISLYSISISYNMLSVFLVCFQNSIFIHTLCFVFFLFRFALFYNNYVLFICTSFYVYK